MNYPPPEPCPNQRPLSDILQDPDTEWADIRAAIKTQGRGSFLVGRHHNNNSSNNNNVIAVTTNAGVLKALREHAVCWKDHQKVSPKTTCTDDSVKGHVDDLDHLTTCSKKQANDNGNSGKECTFSNNVAKQNKHNEKCGELFIKYFCLWLMLTDDLCFEDDGIFIKMMYVYLEMILQPSPHSRHAIQIMH